MLAYSEYRVIANQTIWYRKEFGGETKAEDPDPIAEAVKRIHTYGQKQGYADVEQNAFAKSHPKLVTSNQLAGANPDNVSVNPAEMKPDKLRENINKAQEMAPALILSPNLHPTAEPAPTSRPSPTPMK